MAIYDDRMEITSSGTLHFGLTVEALYGPHESLPWNPLIARVFHRRGIIEQWGGGTLKIVESTQGAGLPRPEIEEGGGCVTVRFRPSIYLPPRRVARDLNELQRTVLATLEASPDGLALRHLRERMNEEVPEWVLKEALAALKHLGLVRVNGRARGARWIFIRD